jgi:hypothetical protein
MAAAAGEAAGQSAASASPSVSGRPEFSSDNGKAPPFRAFAGADTAIGTFSGKTRSNPPFTTIRCALKTEFIKLGCLLAQGHPRHHIPRRRRGDRHANTERRLIRASPRFQHSSYVRRRAGKPVSTMAVVRDACVLTIFKRVDRHVIALVLDVASIADAKRAADESRG